MLTHKDCTPISMCMQWEFKLWPDGRCARFEHGHCYFSLTCRCVSVPGTVPIQTTMWKETWPSASAVMSTVHSLLLTMLTSTWMTHSHREKLSTISLPQIWTRWDWLCYFLVYKHGSCVCVCMCVCACFGLWKSYLYICLSVSCFFPLFFVGICPFVFVCSSNGMLLFLSLHDDSNNCTLLWYNSILLIIWQAFQN